MTYISNKIAVTTSPTIVPMSMNKAYSWSVYPIDGDILVNLKTKENGWGSDIYGYSTVGMGDNGEVIGMKIRSASGTVNVAYYMRGN